MVGNSPVRSSPQAEEAGVPRGLSPRGSNPSQLEIDRVHVSLEVNGRAYHVDVDPDETLLSTIRGRLLLKGTKNGCGEGACGACTVLVNGQARRACKLKSAQLNGARITTIEGVAVDGALHPLQEAFVAMGAVGCGFCTPGMIMTCLALIASDPTPSEDAIRRALRPVLCRCTGYWGVVRAVQRATGQPVAERWQSVGSGAPHRVIGQRVSKIDALEKVTGESCFAADLDLAGQAYATLVRSPHRHARILAVDASGALALQGVLAVLTANDIPGHNGFGKNAGDQPVLADDRVAYRGQPVALVAAESPGLAERAAQELRVTYEVLPATFTAEEAFARGSAEDIVGHTTLERGDATEGLREAAFIVEREFRTQRVDPLFLEPPAGVAEIDSEGRILVHAACQDPYGIRRQIARVLSVPLSQVRIVQTTCGGSFGAKVEANAQIHLALLASRLRRPVKMVFTRQDTFLSAVKRHPMVLTYRVGADYEGRLTAMQVRVLGDAGAYETSSNKVMHVACHDATGPYDVPNVRVDGWMCRTNQVPSGAQRGFGVPQVAFAYESIMDELAEKCGLTPMEIRLRNVVRAGSFLVSGQELTAPVAAEETLLAALPSEHRQIGSDASKQHGTGFAVSFKSVGYSGGDDNVARVEVEVTPEGRVLVHCGGLDMGQGMATVLAQIAAEELGLEPASVVVLPADTSEELDSCSTEASRFTLTSGQAMVEASCQLRSLLLERAARWLGVRARSLCLGRGWICGQDGTPLLSLANLAAHCNERGLLLRGAGEVHLPVPGAAALPPRSAVDVTFCAASAQVQVDPSTGELNIVSIRLALDAGRAINPLNIQSQVEGGVAMALGFATLEDLGWDHDAESETRVGAYRAPRASQIPPIDTIAVERPGAIGPYGAKGIGELPFVPVAPAIANAIYDAVGVRFTELPITQEKLRDAACRFRPVVRSWQWASGGDKCVSEV